MTSFILAVAGDHHMSIPSMNCSKHRDNIFSLPLLIQDAMVPNVASCITLSLISNALVSAVGANEVVGVLP